jgi:peroxiredoxin
MNRAASSRRSHVLAPSLAVLLAGLAGLAGLGLGGCQAESRTEHAHPERSERSLPRFEGKLLDGERASTDLLRRKRGVLFFFASNDPDADALADLLGRLRGDAADANVVLIGVSRDPEPAAAKAWLRTHGIEAAVFEDSSGAISRVVGLRGGHAGVLVVDAEGFLVSGFQGFEADARVDPYEREVRNALHLEAADNAIAPSYGVRPEAPDFSIVSLDGRKLSRADLAGKVVVLMFFSPTCTHCHNALAFFEKLAAQLERPDLMLVPVSVQNRQYVIDDMKSRLGLESRIWVDGTESIFKDYAHGGTVPDTLILDRESRVVARHVGMAPRLEALMTMQVKHALGVENPILLDAKGYSGEEFCSVCHPQQHDTWSLTHHAYAFTTLAEHGAERDEECVSCHTVGFGEPGGYEIAQRQRWLEGVQCENCHGRGGPHQSPDFASRGYEAACAGCHTPEHSLRFVFGERLPLVSHAANAQFTGLDLEARQALLERRDRRERQLFDRGEFVGSQACAGCHASEHELWAKSPHAAALETLGDKHGDADCQACHTTGFGETGGFPDGGEATHGVGCESCHGPGGNHVAEGAEHRGTILALTDKCDSCVIMQICGSCHDEANDPGFEFELLDKIDAIRHGFRDRGAAAE